MPRAIWSGAISFGLVNVPVKLYSAVSRKTVRFHQLHEETGTRIQQKRVDPSTGDEVPYDDIVKGYEIGPDQYVTITPDELASLEPEKTRTIDIEDFVDESEIDPIYYDSNYYLAPGPGAAKPYKLLVAAMGEVGKVAVARFVLRNKESLAAIRPNEDGLLTMSTMLFADEVVDPSTIEDVDAAEGGKTAKREVDMARQLVESLSGPFEPDKYKDEYRDQVMQLIERKASGEEIKLQPAAKPAEPVPDLMAALEASIAAVKGKGDGDDGDKDAGGAKKPAASRSKAKAKAKSGGSSNGSSSGGSKSSGTKKPASRRKTAAKK